MDNDCLLRDNDVLRWLREHRNRASVATALHEEQFDGDCIEQAQTLLDQLVENNLSTLPADNHIDDDATNATDKVLQTYQRILATAPELLEPSTPAKKGGKKGLDKILDQLRDGKRLTLQTECTATDGDQVSPSLTTSSGTGLSSKPHANTTVHPCQILTH